MNTCVNWGFSFATVVHHCMLFLYNMSSVFTRQVSRVYKSKRRWWDCVRGVQCGDFYDLQFQSLNVSDSLVGKSDWRSSKWCDTVVVSQEEWSGSQTDDISHSSRLFLGLVAVRQLSLLQLRLSCAWTFFVLLLLAVDTSDLQVWVGELIHVGIMIPILCNSRSIHFFFLPGTASLHDHNGFRIQRTACHLILFGHLFWWKKFNFLNRGKVSFSWAAGLRIYLFCAFLFMCQQYCLDSLSMFLHNCNKFIKFQNE